MVIALVLAAALAQADAGTDAGVAAIYASCPDAPPIRPVMPCPYGVCEVEVHPDGGIDAVPLEWPWPDETLGYLMSNNRGKRIACFVGACESDRLTKTQIIDKGMVNGTIMPPPGWVWWVGGLALAFATGWAVDHFVPLLRP